MGAGGAPGTRIDAENTVASLKRVLIPYHVDKRTKDELVHTNGSVVAIDREKAL